MTEDGVTKGSTGAQVVDATINLREGTADVSGRVRDPRYGVILDTGDEILLSGTNVSAPSRQAAVAQIRAMLPEENSYGKWGTFPWQVKWETVPDPLAPAVGAMVAQRVEEDGVEDTPELRARTRVRLKAAQDAAKAHS